MSADISREELRRLARVHPVAWAMYASGGRWKRARHLMWLAEQLMALARGDIKRLAVSMPPRHGKSEFISKYFPTWWMGAFPEAKVISCSYGEALTTEWSRAARDAFADHAPAVFGLDTWARSSIKAWDVYRNGRRTGGGLRAVGKGGALTGRGADLLICDDLIRDAQEAGNPALRQAAWEWFASVPLTRLEPGGRAVVVMTRWHHDDIIGRIIEQQARGEAGEPWRIVNLPAIADEPAACGECDACKEGGACEDPRPDAIGRMGGEALWPERYPLSELEKIRRDVGPYVWEALYQGRPTPTEGSMFRREWLHSFTWTTEAAGEPRLNIPGHGPALLSQLHKYVTIDLAASKHTRADYTVIAVWGIHPTARVLCLLDLVRDRVEGPDILPLIKRTMETWHARVGFVESIGFQSTLGQAALRAGIPLRDLRPVGDKITRALPATAVMEQGRMLLPAGASWRGELEAELLQFPEGKHDDQVDAISYGVQVFLEKFGGTGGERRGYRGPGGPDGGDRPNRPGGGWKIGR